ncbi:phage holin family protein [bacterium]|nr:phage holin family protein [bacterium]
MKRFLAQIIVGILGIYLATLLVPGVEIQGGEFSVEGIKVLLFAGLALGVANSILKPILNLITLPLRIITLGLFGLVVNMAIVWIVNLLFPKLLIPNLGSLFWVACIIWLLSFFVPRKKRT